MTDIPSGWVAGSITIDGQPIQAMVKRLRGELKIETVGATDLLKRGAQIKAYGKSWEVFQATRKDDGRVEATADDVGASSAPAPSSVLMGDT